MSPNRYKIPAAFVITLLILARWMTYDADFPAISGSMGEYMDMGINFFNIRSFDLTGFWALEKSPLLYLCPLYYALVSLSVSILGHNFFAYRFWSLFFGSLCILAAGYFLNKNTNRRAALFMMIALSVDAIWFAYSRCEKQEITAASFLLFSAMAIGSHKTPLHKRALVTGFFAAAAILTKINLIVPLAAMILFALAADKELRRFKNAGWLIIGSIGPILIGTAYLADPIMSEGSWKQMVQFSTFYKGAVHRPSGIMDILSNMATTNVYLRSPGLIFALGLSIMTLTRIKSCGPLKAALMGIIIACALAPSLNNYFPLRYRILPIPASIMFLSLFTDDINFECDRLFFGLAKGFCSFLFLGFVFIRLNIPMPILSAFGVGIIAGIIASLLPTSLRILDQPKKIAIACMIVVIGLAQITQFTFQQQSDIPLIAAEVTAKLPPDTRVATNSWWGKMILLGTTFPEVNISSKRASAFLLTRDRDGQWSKKKPPEINLNELELIYEKTAWFGATYFLYIRK